RAHEDAYHQLRLVDMLVQDVFDRGGKAFFDDHDVTARRDAAHVDNGTICGAHEAGCRGWRAWRIAEKPDVPPIEICARGHDGDRGERNYQATRSQAPLRITRTSATPDANGKSMTSKSSLCPAITLSHRLTPAWRISSRT